MTAPEALYHFSEDPGIERFVPHVPPTNPDQEPAVWAIDEEHSPLYWFPRQCPRGTVWARDEAEQVVLTERFGTTARRLHVAEVSWRRRIETARVWVYRFDPNEFAPWDEAEGHWVARVAVTPLDVTPVGGLIERHREAEIELRFVDNLWPFWDEVVGSGLPFSGVRLSNAARPGIR